MKPNKPKTDFEKVKYNFKLSGNLHIDVVPIAERLLTSKNKIQTTVPHRTDFYRIVWFQKGNPTHSVDFEKIEIKSPSLLFIHKDRIHKFDSLTKHDGKVFIFTDEFIFRTESDRAFLPNSIIFNQTDSPFYLSTIDERLVSLLNSIEQEVQTKEQPYKAETLYHLLNSFLYTAERFASFQFQKTINLSPDATLVNGFYSLLERHYKHRLSIEKYAEMLNVTVNKLNIVIQPNRGKTAKKAVTERVILEAKRLLTYSVLNVQGIGFELGFEEPTNFIKFFQSNTKQTPLVFQKLNA
jgi:AraC family transcriptional activator of pobA